MIGKHDELKKLRQGYELENTSLHKKIISDHFLMKKITWITIIMFNVHLNKEHAICLFVQTWRDLILVARW